jgi:hypothetical protein
MRIGVGHTDHYLQQQQQQPACSQILMRAGALERWNIILRTHYAATKRVRKIDTLRKLATDHAGQEGTTPT